MAREPVHTAIREVVREAVRVGWYADDADDGGEKCVAAALAEVDGD